MITVCVAVTVCVVLTVVVAAGSGALGVAPEVNVGGVFTVLDAAAATGPARGTRMRNATTIPITAACVGLTNDARAPGLFRAK